jgi:S1-C subfamily serine protease
MASTSGSQIDKRKGMARGWKITIGIVILVFVVLIIIGANSDSSDNSTTDNSGTTQSIVSSEPLPTVPSQIPNYNTQQAPPAGDAPMASSSETGNVFSSDDVASYLTAVGQVNCNQDGQPYDSGSGSVWQFAGSSQTYVLTNYHVIQGDDSCTFEIFPSDTDGTQGNYDLDISSPMRWNEDTDIALVPITGIDSSFTSSTPIADLNYSIAGLTICPVQIPQEAPVAVLGFPASTQGAFSVLNGVISGYDGTNPDAYDDYYTTAPVDNGDSGGVALSKYNDSVCLLGIPTWVSIGENQNEGDILDINNIFYIDGSQSSQ